MTKDQEENTLKIGTEELPGVYRCFSKSYFLCLYYFRYVKSFLDYKKFVESRDVRNEVILLIEYLIKSLSTTQLVDRGRQLAQFQLASGQLQLCNLKGSRCRPTCPPALTVGGKRHHRDSAAGSQLLSIEYTGIEAPGGGER